MNPIPVNQQQELTAVKAQLTKNLNKANSLEIKDEESLAQASDILRNVKILSKDIKTRKELITKPINEGLKSVRDFFRPFEDSLASIEARIKGQMLKFEAEQRRLEREREAKLQQEVEQGKKTFSDAVQEAVEAPILATSVSGKKGTIQYRVTKAIELVNVEEVPREFMVPNYDLIKQMMLKEGKEVPGFKVIEVKQVASMGR